ncbi:MAG: hypothetical protein BWY71_00411 [Planctomycetes bacterium ADurb.Bin412]|nr:MAG: hypothetical protein BWY71_00411 [Planctomycetes bacterium ADurb.Bin412]
MKKKVCLLVLVALLSAISVSSGAIKSINVSDVESTFTAGGGNFGLGTLALADAANIVVEDTLGQQISYANGSFAMSTYLQSDNSAGGVAAGQFADGDLSFLDSGANILLSGHIGNLNVVEVFNNGGILAGEGQFVVTGGSLTGDFVLPLGKIVQITFDVPVTLSDFSQNFSGSSNLTITPVPEPVSIGLLAMGGLFLCRRKR